ncbi:MAG: DsbA family protein, partial [SAR324 cluster bacterium]|nr:DsbA family protein [SAR324 cluster bacterium]
KDELPEAVHRLYRAYWVEDRDISDTAVLEKLVGVETVEKTGNPEIKKALIEATDEAVNRGLFGAPSFLVGEELFFGHDRMYLLDAHLKGKL